MKKQGRGENLQVEELGKFEKEYHESTKEAKKTEYHQDKLQPHCHLEKITIFQDQFRKESAHCKIWRLKISPFQDQRCPPVHADD